MGSWSLGEFGPRLTTMKRWSGSISALHPAYARMRAEQVRRRSDGSPASDELAAIFDGRAARAEEFLRDPIGYTKKENLERHEHAWRKHGGEGELSELQVQIAAAKLFAILGGDALAHAVNCADAVRQQGNEEDCALSERLVAAIEKLLTQMQDG